MDAADKMMIHVDMQTSYMLYKLNLDAFHEVNREIDRWDEARGFGYEDDWTTEEYAKAHKCAEFQEIWKREQEVGAAWKSYLHDFCNELVAFTDGQIDFDTAMKMATYSRYSERLEKILYGSAANAVLHGKAVA